MKVATVQKEKRAKLGRNAYFYLYRILPEKMIKGCHSNDLFAFRSKEIFLLINVIKPMMKLLIRQTVKEIFRSCYTPFCTGDKLFDQPDQIFARNPSYNPTSCVIQSYTQIY